jgi:hypothetical protein
MIADYDAVILPGVSDEDVHSNHAELDGAPEPVNSPRQGNFTSLDMNHRPLYVKTSDMFGKKKTPGKTPGSPKMLVLDIGENDPVGNKLVSIEMDEVAKMKFKSPKESRNQSINRIFGKMVKTDTDNDVIAAKARLFMSPKATRKSILPYSPTALQLESDDGVPGVQISMKTFAQRKCSYTPNRYYSRGYTAVDDDAFDNAIME